ncbi:uncharacterized protein LOC113463888 [Ceratina calcarata]|uniref:Uncharacterized protein LOC113463888 n=1 Tax=Ceratina calcarata TaxID=156304 RepID=A0AAJ7RWX4_9HYME|nr:uncharacterized protein LOC113463888 [Ceratina calcarata]
MFYHLRYGKIFYAPDSAIPQKKAIPGSPIDTKWERIAFIGLHLCFKCAIDGTSRISRWKVGAEKVFTVAGQVLPQSSARNRRNRITRWIERRENRLMAELPMWFYDK